MKFQRSFADKVEEDAKQYVVEVTKQNVEVGA